MIRKEWMSSMSIETLLRVCDGRKRVGTKTARREFVQYYNLFQGPWVCRKMIIASSYHPKKYLKVTLCTVFRIAWLILILYKYMTELTREALLLLETIPWRYLSFWPNSHVARGKGHLSDKTNRNCFIYSSYYAW